MRIRRYTGKDAQEAMLKVKMDLGSEAIILSTRKVRKKGLAGLFGKPLTEVLAAIDEDYGKKRQGDTAVKTLKNAGVYGRNGTMRTQQDEDNRMESLENRLKLMESMLEQISNNVGSNQGAKIKSIEKDTGGLNQVPKQSIGVNQWNAEVVEPIARESTAHNNCAIISKTLEDNEVELAIVEKMMDKIKQHVKNSSSFEETQSLAQKIITNLLGKPETIQFREDGKPTVVLFLGPTGVGKTTTLAKIAANYSLNHQKKIGLITADTYRIAAVEQLKTYAEILNIPISVIYTPQDIQDAIAMHQDKDLILIDTAGRSHKNAAQFSELKMLANAAEADETYLVLSCSMGRVACAEILKNYSFLKDYKLLFTKLDEAIVPGIILNARCTTGKSLSYTTAGQSVPDDIEVADVAAITNNMITAKSTNR